MGKSSGVSAQRSSGSSALCTSSACCHFGMLCNDSIFSCVLRMLCSSGASCAFSMRRNSSVFRCGESTLCSGGFCCYSGARCSGGFCCDLSDRGDTDLNARGGGVLRAGDDLVPTPVEPVVHAV